MGRNIWVIVVAAGSGTRYGSDVPKQFLELLPGKSVLDCTIEGLVSALPGAKLITVLAADRVADAVWPNPVAGGAIRSESVANALSYIYPFATDEDIVLIHDGARPVIDREVIQRIMQALDAGADAVVPVLEMTDSMLQRLPDGSIACVDRSQYCRVQTPQAFRLSVLRSAYGQMQREGTNFTDDLSAVLHYTDAVAKDVAGDIRNIKITHKGDLETAAGILAKQC